MPIGFVMFEQRSTALAMVKCIVLQEISFKTAKMETQLQAKLFRNCWK
jgi:hypothetical protein